MYICESLELKQMTIQYIQMTIQYICDADYEDFFGTEQCVDCLRFYDMTLQLHRTDVHIYYHMR